MTGRLIPSKGGHPILVYFYDGSDWRAQIIDSDGHVQVDIIASALPSGAATAANQALILAQVQAIEDLTHALQSVASDRLIVRGEDQLFSFGGVLGVTEVDPISGADGYFDSDTPPAGHIWCITDIEATDATTATTLHQYYLRRGGLNLGFRETRAALAANQPSYWSGFKWLDPGAVVRVYFTGGLAADACRITLTGYDMTLET